MKLKFDGCVTQEPQIRMSSVKLLDFLLRNKYKCVYNVFQLASGAKLSCIKQARHIELST